MTAAKKNTSVNKVVTSLAMLRKRVNAHLNKQIKTWPVIFRVGENGPPGCTPSLWTELSLRHLAKAYPSCMAYREVVYALVLDPSYINSESDRIEDVVQMWWSNFTWGSSELWRDHTVSYTSVWLMLCNLLEDARGLSAGELMNALSMASHGHSDKLLEDLVCYGADNRRAEQAHRLVQQFLLDPFADQEVP